MSKYKYDYVLPVPMVVADGMVRGAAAKAGVGTRLYVRDGFYEFMPF
ncbi:hypothetical protein HMPREF0185_02593 [Brevundimonas diminuta 470-4]|nr:hypothetical protein HMPREF0185_02593 [Brevundimonas diminuta 470-4]